MYFCYICGFDTGGGRLQGYSVCHLEMGIPSKFLRMLWSSETFKQMATVEIMVIKARLLSTVPAS